MEIQRQKEKEEAAAEAQRQLDMAAKKDEEKEVPEQIPVEGFEFEIRLTGGMCLFFSSIGGSFTYKIKDSPDTFNLKYD